MRLAIAALTLLVAACTSWGDSTLTEVTQADIDGHPFLFRVTTEFKADNFVWFRVHVEPREERRSWCVSGSLEVLSDTLRVGSFDVEPKSEDGGWRWIYSFMLSQDYVRGSRFTFRDLDCEMPAFDGYLFSLEEHCKECARPN
jgi:hypothetical protein